MRYYKVAGYDIHDDGFRKLVYLNGELVSSFLYVGKAYLELIQESVKSFALKGENVC